MSFCPEPPLISVAGLRMDFGSRTVIEDLSFDVRAGETFGLLGSNGSGKTTTIRALLGILPATAGALRLNGEAYSPRSGVRVGYLPEERGLYRKEPVQDVMIYFGRLKGLGRSEAKRWSTEYLERVGLADKARTRIDTLSGGQQQKVQLGLTIMNSPELLILDEPTKGFDPVNRKLLAEIIQEAQGAGATVIMVSHNMDEVERTCDRILMLKDGIAAAYGTVAEVQERFGSRTASVSFEKGPAPGGDWATTATGAQRVLDVDESASALLSELVAAGILVTGFTVQPKPLDEIFLEVYGSHSGSES